MRNHWPPGRAGTALFGLFLLMLLAACTTTGSAVSETDRARSSESGDVTSSGQESSTRLPEDKYEEFRLVTLLPRDAIPAIDDPEFLTVSEADRFYDPDELVMGVEFNDDARAYSVPFLSGHEIVNDTVGGVKIAVTW